MNSFEGRFNKIGSENNNQDPLTSSFVNQPSSLSFEERFNQFTPKKKSKTEKALRTAAQYGLGVLQGSVPGIVYDIGTAPAASRGYLTNLSLEDMGKEIEYLSDKNYGKSFNDWDPKDKEIYEDLSERILNPQKVYEEQKPVDISIRGLAEKVSGQDLHPEGALEKIANWAGFIKNPQNTKNLFTIGLTPKTLTKAILPGPTEAIRGISAGTALQMAEDGKLGPLGTIGAAIAGDLIGHAPKATLAVAKEPKKYAAQAVNFLTRSNSKKLAAQQLVEDFNKSGLQIDAGTLTNSPLVQMIQARLSQSGLTGDALDNFRKNLSDQIVKEYENILGDIGNLSFENAYQAGEAVKNALRTEEIALNIPKESIEERAKNSRSLIGRITQEEQPAYQNEFLDRIAPQEFESNYQAGVNLKTAAEDIKEPIKQEFNQRWSNFNEEIANLPPVMQPELESYLTKFIEDHRGSLLLGESSAEYRVFQDAQRLLDSITQRNHFGIGATVSDLIKTKRTLADIANWEFGGSNFESAYKNLVGELDNAITRSLQATNPELLQGFQTLNADYSAFKDMFENENLKHLFEPKNQNYNALFNEIVSNPDKIRALEDIFYNHPRGQQLMDQIKRDYAQKVINNPNSTGRDFRNLSTILGPQNAQALNDFLIARQHALDHPLPRAAQQPRLGLTAPSPQTKSIKGLEGKKISETGTESARTGVRKKMYEYLSKKKGVEDIFKEMNTVEGIKKLRRALELTPEGKELFKELSRFKLAEMIDKKMKNGVTEQIKLGTFSGLLKETKNQAIVKELIGKEAYEKLQLLQKNSGKLASSAEKFYNSSKSGTTIADMAVVSSAITGLLTGNFYLALPAVAKWGGSKILADLLADPIFLKELEKAVLSDPKKLNHYLEKMRPSVEKAILQQQKHQNLM